MCCLQVRWQEAVAGSGVVIGMGKQGRVFKTVDEEEDEEGELDEDGNLCVKCSFDPDESEAAVNSWGALFTEQRNRYPDDHRRRSLPPRGFIWLQHRHLLRELRAQGSRRGRPGFTDPRRRLTQRPRRGHRAAVH